MAIQTFRNGLVFGFSRTKCVKSSLKSDANSAPTPSLVYLVERRRAFYICDVSQWPNLLAYEVTTDGRETWMMTRKLHVTRVLCHEKKRSFRSR